MRRVSPEGRRAVGEYSAAELHRFLVEDAVKRHATYLRWAVKAYERIGMATGRGAEDAYQAVLDEVEALTGLRRLPVAEPATSRDLR